MELITLVIFLITSLIIFVKAAISNASAANRLVSAIAASAAFFVISPAELATLLTPFFAFLNAFFKKSSLFFF